MNKTKTPMATLKGHFLNFEENIAHLIDTKAIARVELNKSQPHYSPYGDSSKGVASDFVRIYQDRTNVVGKKKSNSGFGYQRNEYNSFAFVFNYMEVEEPYITVTLKTDGNHYISSHAYSVEQMKNLMSSFNNYLKTIDVEHPTRLFKLIQDIFIGDDGVDEEEVVSEAISSINETLFDLNKGIEEQQRTYNSVKVMYVNASEKYKEELENSEEYKTVQELKKQLHKAEEKLSKKDRGLKVDYKIKPKKSLLKTESSTLETLKNKKEVKLTKIIKQYPLHLRQDILNNIS